MLFQSGFPTTSTDLLNFTIVRWKEVNYECVSYCSYAHSRYSNKKCWFTWVTAMPASWSLDELFLWTVKSADSLLVRARTYWDTEKGWITWVRSMAASSWSLDELQYLIWVRSLSLAVSWSFEFTLGTVKSADSPELEQWLPVDPSRRYPLGQWKLTVPPLNESHCQCHFKNKKNLTHTLFYLFLFELIVPIRYDRYDKKIKLTRNIFSQIFLYFYVVIPFLSCLIIVFLHCQHRMLLLKIIFC
jgi:hypothetical protein